MTVDSPKAAKDLDIERNDIYGENFVAVLSQQRNNALTSKISKVLSASYADSEIRDALKELDGRHVYNTPDFRRTLHLDAQKEVIECNAEIVDQFGALAERLRRVGSTISKLNNRCDDMRQQFSAARRENAPILEETSTLLGQRKEAETKKQLLEAFSQHFIVSESDTRILISNTDVVDDVFFETLSRIKRIHKDCQILLGAENQRLGLELMEQSSRSLNGAYQKLYRWTQRELKLLNIENPHISPMIRRALKALAERPTLFQSCLDFFVEAREHVLLDAFYTALTGPSDGRDSDTAAKPIEYHSHDPLRYVGDMLAWTHAASVSEREAVENLAMTDGDEITQGIKEGTENEPWSNIDGDMFDGRRALEELASRNLVGVIQVLRQRVEQIIQHQEDPVLTYKFVNLICFYRVTFTKLMGPVNTVLETLTALEEIAFGQFQAIMLENVRFVQADLSRPPPDFRLPDFLTEILDQLRSLVKSFDTSLTTISNREKDFKKVLAVALDPFLDMCKKVVQDFEDPLHDVFLINCLQAAQKTILGYDFVQEKLNALKEDIASHSKQLVEFQHSFFLHNSGLYPMIDALTSASDVTSDSTPSIKAMSIFRPAALKQASQTLDDFLPSALMDAKENVKFLDDKQLASSICAEATERFCEDFEFLENQLYAYDESIEVTGSNQEARTELDMQPLREHFPRTGVEIRILLS